MNTPKHTQSSPDNQSGDQPVSARRRKLLKAAATGAPVVATLSSGAAMANVSAYQCLINDDKRDDTLTQIHEQKLGGGWLQIELDKETWTGTWTCTKDNTSTTTPNDGCTGDAPSDIQTTYVVLVYKGTYREYDSSKQYLKDMVVVEDPPWKKTLTADDNGWLLVWDTEPTETSTVWAVAYYERLEDYTDIIAGPDLLQVGESNWQALTGSCWTSLGGLGGKV